MEINDHLSHDLKTERGNLSGGLPGYYRIVPIGFYVSIVASIMLSIYYYMDFRDQREERDRWAKHEQTQNKEAEDLHEQLEQIELEQRRADVVVDWIRTAQGVQPLVAAISRSIGPESAIDVLTLERNGQQPNQLGLKLNLDGNVREQLDHTASAIRDLKYRSFSAEQSQAVQSLDFKATLIWENF